MITIVINILGLLAIAFIVWWFWWAGRNTAGEGYSAAMEILVRDGVYEPDRIEVPAGRAVTLNFLREDPSPCAEYVVFADLDISAQLAVGKTTAVDLPALDQGQYSFTCQMQMYRGSLIVR